MTERLRTVVTVAETLSPTEQDALAQKIEALLPSTQPAVGLTAIDFSVFADLPDDDVDVLDHWRHEAPPTPAYEKP